MIIDYYCAKLWTLVWWHVFFEWECVVGIICTYPAYIYALDWHSLCRWWWLIKLGLRWDIPYGRWYFVVLWWVCHKELYRTFWFLIFRRLLAVDKASCIWPLSGVREWSFGQECSREVSQMFHQRQVTGKNTRYSYLLTYLFTYFCISWLYGIAVNVVCRINKVNQRWAGELDKWPSGSADGQSISVCNQPSRSTQPGHPSVGRCNE